MSGSSELTVRVASKSQETADIALFELVSADDTALPVFEAGAHIDVHLPDGTIRQYSLCNDPADETRYLLGVLKDPNSRGGSVAMHEQVHEGDTLTISAPRNHFPIDASATHHVLLAGGIGVTPILCMAEELGPDSSFEMHYCTRAEDRTAFRSRIAESSFADKVQFHFDDAGDEQRLDLAGLTSEPQAGTHLYVCGPTGFMEWVLTTARDAGWDEGQLHYEFFSAEIDTEGDESFEVELKSSGVVVSVSKDQTVLQALSAVGVDIQMSCEVGVCGTCVTGVVEGLPDHKDMYLMPAEHAANDKFTPCCSRSLSPRLVLDL